MFKGYDIQKKNTKLTTNEKGEKTEKVSGKNVISLYSTRISRVVKMADTQKLQQDLENDPIIRDQMTN